MNHPERHTILVVDDEEVIRESLIEFLEEDGYSATGAGSAEEALEVLGDTAIDLVVVDLRLPGMSGEGLILELRKHFPATKYLIHTGSADYALPEDLVRVGVRPEQVYYKPVHDLDIIAVGIKALLDS